MNEQTNKTMKSYLILSVVISVTIVGVILLEMIAR